jgi:hypothetical protein
MTIWELAVVHLLGDLRRTIAERSPYVTPEYALIRKDAIWGERCGQII